MKYKLYVESGPKMRTTMVHVLDLLGCTANGKTTEQALAATPTEIREYLRFLKKHGDDVDPKAPFDTEIATHVMEGTWIGYGDPDSGFAPDFEPLTEKDEKAYRRRFGWLGEALGLLSGAGDLTGQGRATHDIITHIANAELEYFRASGIGKPDGTKEALTAIEDAGDSDLAPRLADLWHLLDEQLATITPAIRKAKVQRGLKLWTARRGFRRALEHPWEHLREIERRLQAPTKSREGAHA